MFSCARPAGLDAAAAVLDSGEPSARIRTRTTTAPEPTASPLQLPRRR